jgi:hypothetical protein
MEITGEKASHLQDVYVNAGGKWDSGIFSDGLEDMAVEFSKMVMEKRAELERAKLDAKKNEK